MDRAALASLGPLYHSYQFFGAHNQQLPGIYPLNQQAKEPNLRAYVAFALAKAQAPDGQGASFIELFCADGYYAMMASKLGASKAVGLDNDKDGHLGVASVIADRLDLRTVQFVRGDVYEADKLGSFDVVANVGGLYHVADPERALDISYQMARRYLIVQTVVSMANDDPHYFVQPAPGWSWGSRFSRASFDRIIAQRGWNVIDNHFNQLTGNDRLEDRGSNYYLIEKQR